MKVEYQVAGSANWIYIDTVISPSATRTDPLTGMIVPACGQNQAHDGTTTSNGYDQSGTGHATATATITSGVVTAITLGAGAGTNTGYTEQPYVYLLHGAGSGSYITSSFANVSVTGLTLQGNSAAYTNFLLFGGSGLSTNRDRFVVLKAQDTTTVNYFGIKACRLSLIHI